VVGRGVQEGKKKTIRTLLHKLEKKGGTLLWGSWEGKTSGFKGQKKREEGGPRGEKTEELEKRGTHQKTYKQKGGGPKQTKGEKKEITSSQNRE